MDEELAQNPELRSLRDLVQSVPGDERVPLLKSPPPPRPRYAVSQAFGIDGRSQAAAPEGEGGVKSTRKAVL